MNNFCNICPRNCNVDRSKNVGFCGVDNNIYINKIMIHHYEEPCISGDDKIKGSGAIFFASCNLKCVYCQNYEISRTVSGTKYSPKDLADIMRKLEMNGAYNINLVTPTHFTKQILEALKIYKPRIPIIWNTSGYEKVETIEKLKGWVDVFLTDFKYYSPKVSMNYSSAKDYYKFASEALKKMREIIPIDKFENGMIKKGIIVRHLLLPNNIKDSVNVLENIKSLIGNPILSLMSQYTPMQKYEYEELNNRIRPIEYKMLLSKAEKLGFDKIYIQDFSSADSKYTPDFK